LNGMLPRIAARPANLDIKDGSRPHIQLMGKILSVLYIPFSIAVIGTGIFLLWLPWQRIWENNHMLFRYPQIRPLIANSFFKGAIFGLGITDILIGIHQIAHFKDAHKKGFFPW
jgi:hypothetical protein